MNQEAKAVIKKIEGLYRKASIAQIGGFRPPEKITSSWFGGRGVGMPGEKLPAFGDKSMFPLIQINLEELPFIPDALSNTKLLILFINREEIPFDKPHGDGWLIRDYGTLEWLVPLAEPETPSPIRPFSDPVGFKGRMRWPDGRIPGVWSI